MINRIILTANPRGLGYSVEAGLHNNKFHFDHHGDFTGEVPVCINKNAYDAIKTPREPLNYLFKKDALNIETTHFDADTFICICHMIGISLADCKFNLDKIAAIDTNGSSAVADLYDESLLYMIGLSKIANSLNFPRAVKEKDIDVTPLYELMFCLNYETIIEEGRKAQMQSEKDFNKCILDESKHFSIILLSCDRYDNIDPSMAYSKGYDTIIVHRRHRGTISIYHNPSSDYSSNGKTYAGIKFTGRDKACGSPRGDIFTVNDAQDVYNAIKKIK